MIKVDHQNQGELVSSGSLFPIVNHYYLHHYFIDLKKKKARDIKKPARNCQINSNSARSNSKFHDLNNVRCRKVCL